MSIGLVASWALTSAHWQWQLAIGNLAFSIGMAFGHWGIGMGPLALALVIRIEPPLAFGALALELGIDIVPWAFEPLA